MQASTFIVIPPNSADYQSVPPTLAEIGSKLVGDASTVHAGKGAVYPVLRGPVVRVGYTAPRPVIGEIVHCSWHPYLHTVVFALKSNVIVFYDMNHEQWSPVVLHSAVMSEITSVVWRPCSRSTLAVSCESGVCIWVLFSGNAPPFPSLSRRDEPVPDEMSADRREVFPDNCNIWMDHLTFWGHSQVRGLSWSPSGQFLASSSPTSVVVWDVASKTGTPLWMTSDPVTLWSPGTTNLVAAYDYKRNLRIYNTITLESKKWKINTAVTDICWVPTGNHLMVTCDTGIMIFSQSPSGMVYNTCYQFSTSSEAPLLHISSAQLDPSGCRMAVCFDKFHIAIISVCLNKTGIHILDNKGFVVPPKLAGELVQMNFAPHFPHGALLSCVWEHSTSFVPLYFRR
ncbi:aladin [Pelomyxa schiedti]|nr:aladin [Pelomyxa schiedti]